MWVCVHDEVITGVFVFLPIPAREASTVLLWFLLLPPWDGGKEKEGPQWPVCLLLYGVGKTTDLARLTLPPCTGTLDTWGELEPSQRSTAFLGAVRSRPYSSFTQSPLLPFPPHLPTPMAFPRTVIPFPIIAVILFPLSVNWFSFIRCYDMPQYGRKYFSRARVHFEWRQNRTPKKK